MENNNPTVVFKNLATNNCGEKAPLPYPQPPTSDPSPLHPLSLNLRPSQTFPSEQTDKNPYPRSHSLS